MRTEEKYFGKNLDFRDPGNSIFPALNEYDGLPCNRTSKFKSFKTNKQLKKKICKDVLKRMKDKNYLSCKLLNYNNGYSPFFLPIIYNPKILKLSQKIYQCIISRGIPIGTNYKYLVST